MEESNLVPIVHVWSKLLDHWATRFPLILQGKPRRKVCQIWRQWRRRSWWARCCWTTAGIRRPPKVACPSRRWPQPPEGPKKSRKKFENSLKNTRASSFSRIANFSKIFRDVAQSIYILEIEHCRNPPCKDTDFGRKMPQKCEKPNMKFFNLKNSRKPMPFKEPVAPYDFENFWGCEIFFENQRWLGYYSGPTPLK